MAHNLALRRELERVVDELHRHQIDVMLLKGAALVPLVHRDPGVRPMDDLDLLVHGDDLALADRVIRALGYTASESTPVANTRLGSTRTAFSPHHLSALVRTDGKVTIELHHKLGSSGSAADFDVAGLWARAVPSTAGEVSCSRPSTQDLLAHLCLHFLVDRARLFSRRALGQLCDIAATLDTFADAVEWDTLIGDAADRGYSLALALALETTAAVLDICPPDGVVAALVPHTPCTPDADSTVARRVLRSPSWTTLEQLTLNRFSVRHLLSPIRGGGCRGREDTASVRDVRGYARGPARRLGFSAVRRKWPPNAASRPSSKPSSSPTVSPTETDRLVAAREVDRAVCPARSPAHQWWCRVCSSMVVSP